MFHGSRNPWNWSWTNSVPLNEPPPALHLPNSPLPNRPASRSPRGGGPLDTLRGLLNRNRKTRDGGSTPRGGHTAPALVAQRMAAEEAQQRTPTRARESPRHYAPAQQMPTTPRDDDNVVSHAVIMGTRTSASNSITASAVAGATAMERDKARGYSSATESTMNGSRRVSRASQQNIHQLNGMRPNGLVHQASHKSGRSGYSAGLSEMRSVGA